MLARDRSFFGIYRVTADGDGYHELYDGTTLHGTERYGAAGKPVPLTYYTRDGPAGQALRGAAAGEHARLPG